MYREVYFARGARTNSTFPKDTYRLRKYEQKQRER